MTSCSPIFGLFFRFHVDCSGELRPSRDGYRFILVIIEAFSKWIDLVPLKACTSEAVAASFRERVLSRFGTPVEVVCDNGSENLGAMRHLLLEHGIDQRFTSRGHPAAIMVRLSEL